MISVENSERFASELTDLSNRYGIGISGALMFAMDTSGDGKLAYRVEPGDKLQCYIIAGAAKIG